MGQRFDQTCNQMKNWRWENPRAFGDQVDRSYPQRACSGKVKRNGECFSQYVSDDLRAKIEPPSCRQYKTGDSLAVRPLNWDERLDKEDDGENCEDPRAPSDGRSHPGDANNNNNGEGEEDTQGHENGTRKGKGTNNEQWNGKATEDRKGKGRGKGKGNSKGKGGAKHTPGGDDISCAVALQWHKEMSEPDLDTEG
jgi:hypothetical protein